MSRSRREFLKSSCLAVGFLGFLGSAGRMFAIPRTSNLAWDGVVKNCVITCPVCNTKVQEVMSSETPKRKYHCPKCLTWLSPKSGDHCIYDSYGSVKCPPIQIKERRAKELPI
jgi:hypothetical protein